MKIDKIDSERSIPKQQVAFHTVPPLTDEVWEQFENLGYHGNLWTKEDDLLIWRGGSDLSKELPG